MGLNVYSDKWYIFKNRSTAHGRSRVGSRGDEAVDQDARGDGNVERIHALCLVDAGGNGNESVARATNVGAQTGTFVAHDEKRRRGDEYNTTHPHHPHPHKYLCNNTKVTSTRQETNCSPKSTKTKLTKKKIPIY